VADNEVNAKLTADTKEAVKNVEKLGDEFEETADEAEDAEDAVAAFGERLSKMGGRMSSVGTALSVGVTAPIIGVAGAAINLGINAIEAESLFETSFGGMADSVRQWSLETSDALGLNEFELRRQSATIFTMTQSMGISNDAARDMAQGISVLAGDMASFFNTSPEEAFNKLRSGITGEAEPLKQLGILVTENFIKQTDFAQAILATGRELTEQEKVIARYQAILEQTSTAQGDLARTAESPANRIRIMGTAIEVAGTKLGLALLPVVERALPLFEKMVTGIEKAVNAFAKMPPGAQNAIIALVGLVAAAGPLLVIAGQLVSAWGAVTTAVVGFAAPAAGSVTVTTAVTATMTKLAAILPTVTGGVTLAGVGAVAASTALVGLTVAAGGFIGVGIGSALNQAAIESRGYADATDQAIEKVGLFEAGLSLLPDLFNSLKNAGVAVFEGFVALPGLFLDWLSSTQLVETASALLTSTLEALGPVGDFVESVASRLADAWNEFFSFFGEGVAFIQTKIQEFGEALFAFGDAAKPALDPIGDATAEQTKALEDFIAKQNEATAGANLLAEAEGQAGAATAMSAAEAKKAAAARTAEATATKNLADQLGTAGLVASAEAMQKALDELNKRGEALSSGGLDKVLKKIQELKDEGITLTGTFAEVDQKFKDFSANALANLPPIIPPTIDWAVALNDVGAEFDEVSNKVPELVKAGIGGIGGLQTSTVDWGAAQSKVNDFLSQGRGLFDLLDVSSDNFFSKALSGVSKLFDMFNSLTGILGKVSGLFGGIFGGGDDGGGLGGLLSGGKGLLSKLFGGSGAASGAASSGATAGTSFLGSFGSTISGGLSSLGSTLATLFTNPFTIGIGAALGGFLLIKNLFGGRDAGTVGEEAGRDMGIGISDALAQSIFEAEKPIQLFLREIFAEGQLSAARLAEEQADIFAGIEQGAFSAQEGMAALGASVPDLIANFDELGTAGESQVERLLRAAFSTGETFEGMNEVVSTLGTSLVDAAQQGGDAWLTAQNEIGTTGRESLEFLRNAYGELLPESVLASINEILGLNAAIEETKGVTSSVNEEMAKLPEVAAESVAGVAEAFATGSEEIVEGLGPISETMANEIRQAGEETSTAIDASFRSTNEAIKSGLGEVSSTFVSQVAPAALAAAAATDRITEAAREAARAAASITFPSPPGGGGGGGGGADMSSAAGFRGVLGADTLIQAHRGEFVNIVPEAQTRTMDFASAQNGMGPGMSAERSPNIDMRTTLVFQASGNRKEDDRTVDKLIKELSAEDGRKRAMLQRQLGVRPQ
jgi:hypothetical protein